MLVAALAVASLGVAGCSDGEGASGASEDGAAASSSVPYATEPLDVSFTDAPAGLGDGVSFVQDLRCGDAEANLIDIAVPTDALPSEGGDGEAAPAPSTPLVINLHGGGFVAGDKDDAWDDDQVEPLATLLGKGVAVASMDYSLLGNPDPDGVIKPLMDAARCLQYVRYHGPATFGIDPERIVLRGGSAGAGTSLWLALHDDLADPAADDPVLRQSTKPLAVVAIETQATYDLVRWSTDVFGQYAALFGGKDLIQLAQQFGLSDRLLSFYGITDPALLGSPEIVRYRADVDLLGLMDADDPPAWIGNTREEESVPITVGLLFHHADHARALERQAAAVGYDATVTAGHDAVPSVSETDYALAALDAG